MARVSASLDRRCLLSETTRMDVPRYGELRAPFHVLLDGQCQLQLGGTVMTLKPGDVVLIPNGAPHRITTFGSGPRQGTAETEGDAFITTRSELGGAAVIDLFCGHYTFDAGAGAMLFRSLPNPVRVSFGQSAESSNVLRMLSALMRGEAQREGTGTSAILAALCTVLLAMVLRTSRGATTTATLWTATTDDRIAKTIERVMDDPGAEWSIDRLHRAAAMSRATFLRRFTRSTGITVGAFLTRARLMAAAELLKSSDATVATIAGKVGYHSESSFARAFRTEVGTTPAQFRRTQQGSRSRAAQPRTESDSGVSNP
jgi:AraC family transcriptional activator of mtrCDE